MKKTFRLDGEIVIVVCRLFSAKSDVIEVTCFSDSVENYILSGKRTLKLEGITNEGKEIDEEFKLVSIDSDGVFNLETISD